MIKAALKVKNKTYLAPNYLRIYFEGENVSLFKNVPAAANCKLVIQLPEIEDSEVARTYTFKGINPENNELWVDFIVYNGMGLMTEWAKECKLGDTVVLLTREENPPLVADANWYVLAGDSVGIPVISTILENLPAWAEGHCFIEAHDQGVQIPICTHSKVTIQWIFNNDNGKTSELPELIRHLEIPECSKFGYFAAELNAVKEIRTYLTNEKQWERTILKALPFWKYGTTEDESSEERHHEARV